MPKTLMRPKIQFGTSAYHTFQHIVIDSCQFKIGQSLRIVMHLDKFCLIIAPLHTTYIEEPCFESVTFGQLFSTNKHRDLMIEELQIMTGIPLPGRLVGNETYKADFASD